MANDDVEEANMGATVISSSRGARKRWIAVAVAAMLVAGIGTFVLLRSPASAGDEFDKSNTAGDSVLGYGTRRDVGYVFTDTTSFLALKHGPVTLRSIDFKIEGSTVRQLGPPMVAQILPESDAYRDTVVGYPPSQAQIAELKWGTLVPAEGAVLTVPAGQDHADYVILIGLEITGTGRSFRTEPDITYQVPGNWRESKVHLNVSLVICSPQTDHEHEDCE